MEAYAGLANDSTCGLDISSCRIEMLSFYPKTDT